MEIAIGGSSAGTLLWGLWKNGALIRCTRNYSNKHRVGLQKTVITYFWIFELFCGSVQYQLVTGIYFCNSTFPKKHKKQSQNGSQQITQKNNSRILWWFFFHTSKTFIRNTTTWNCSLFFHRWANRSSEYRHTTGTSRLEHRTEKNQKRPTAGRIRKLFPTRPFPRRAVRARPPLGHWPASADRSYYTQSSLSSIVAGGGEGKGAMRWRAAARRPQSRREVLTVNERR